MGSVGSVGRMGRVGKREHHLTAWQCRALGSDNPDQRTTYYPYYPHYPILPILPIKRTTKKRSQMSYNELE
jgi:hypothetical protein